METKNSETKNSETNNSEIEDTNEFDSLEKDEGGGSYCCGKRMVERGIVFLCLKCGAWEYSSS